MNDDTRLTMQIAQDLPNFPSDIIEDWLITKARTLGWPPRPDNPKDTAFDWRYDLEFEDLAYWKGVKWVLLDSTIGFRSLSDASRRVVKGMIDAYHKGLDNEYSRGIGDGRDRFQSCLAYIKENGAFPRAIVAVANENGRLDVFSGNHRVTALCVARVLAEESAPQELARYGEHITFSYWLGTPTEPKRFAWSDENLLLARLKETD